METLIIKFITPPGQSLLMSTDCQFKLDIPKCPLHFDVEVLDVGPYNSYTLRSQPMSTKFSEEILKQIYNSLYLSCLEFPINLLLDPSLISSFVPINTLKEISTRHNVTAESDFIGLQQVKSGTILMTVLPPTIKNSSDYKIFEQKVNRFLNTKQKEDDRLIRAIELYNSSFYLSSINQSAKFIILMCAVEVLLKPEKVSLKLRLTIESIKMRICRLKIVKEEKDSFLGSIEYLKKSSITTTGKILSEKLLDNTNTYNGYTPSVFFKKAYDLRSKFVHYGINKTKYLDIKNIQIERFVKDLITAYFNKICC